VAGRHLQAVLGEKGTALFDGLAVVAAGVFDKSVEDDLYLVVLGDVLMFFMAAVLTQESETVDVLLESLLLARRKPFQDPEKLLSDQFGPVKSLLMVVLLEVLGSTGQNRYVFGSEKPTLQLPDISNLAVLSILFK
jgi:hypothetical protein